MNKDEWNGYREKGSERDAKACRFNGANRALIMNAFINAGTIEELWLRAVDSMKVGDFIVYGINPSSEAFALDENTFNEKYEVTHYGIV